MKAVLIQEPRKIEIVDLPNPIPQKGEALLKIKYCGICGSDVATFTGNQPFASYPRIPGHEFSAEIVQIEKNEFGLKEGMVVTANPYFNCGKCYSCRRGFVNCCEENQTMGVQRDGAFCEYIAMPLERIYTGKGMPEKTLALIEPFSISYHAISRGKVKSGDNVLVFGAGAIGLFAMLSAKLCGARVYVADILEKRLENAMKMGADGIINVEKEDVREKVAGITNGDNMDVCVEAVGSPKAFLDCIENAAFAGTVILIGNGKKEACLNQSVIVKKELNIYGSRNSLNDFIPLIELVSSSKASIDNMISDVYPFNRSLDAFDTLLSGDGSKMKILIEF